MNAAINQQNLGARKFVQNYQQSGLVCVGCFWEKTDCALWNCSTYCVPHICRLHALYIQNQTCHKQVIIKFTKIIYKPPKTMISKSSIVLLVCVISFVSSQHGHAHDHGDHGHSHDEPAHHKYSQQANEAVSFEHLNLV